MTDFIWRGGAAAVTQVDIITFGDGGGGWTGDGTIRTTMTAEDGTTQVETTAAQADTIEVNRDAHLVTLQGSTQTLFAAVTWAASGTTIITGTAKVQGVPFYQNSDESVNDTTGTIAVTNDGSGSSVLSEGPEDINTDGSGNYNSTNWITADGADSTKPSTGAHVIRLNQGAWSLRYGCVQGVAVKEIRMTTGWTGDYGDIANGYAPDYDANNASPKVMSINKIAGRVLTPVVCDFVNISGTDRGADAVKFQASADIDTINGGGPGVRGTVTVTDGGTLDNLAVGPGTTGTYIIGAVNSLDIVSVGSGNCDLNMGAKAIATRVRAHGTGTIRHYGSTSAATVARWESLGNSYSEYNGQGTLTFLENDGAARFTLENSEADAVTITKAVLRGGHIEEGSQVNATWGNFYKPTKSGTASVSATITEYSTSAES